MDIIGILIGLVLNVDQELAILIQIFGGWTYAVLFAVIFVETGVVIFPFLPGDSLLFIAGALSASGMLGIDMLFITFAFAAILGDTINYWIGRTIGRKIFSKNSRFFSNESLEKAQEFYKKHGGKTIVLARFIPIIRTFAPFVAGIGVMNYRRFIAYNAIGGLAWVSLFLLSGYFFGTIKIIHDNLSIVIICIILISLLPVFFGLLRSRFKQK